uniref:Uncharacterized protein n=1 Tax=Plectus sambesii TaxID=2011161 RepID=A0A914XDM9_9BILA
MMTHFLLVVIASSFLLTANEAKPDTIEIIQNGANTEIIDFQPNGREEVIDINQTPYGSNTYVREYSWYPNYNYGYGNNYYGYNNGYYNNYYNNNGYYNYYNNNKNNGYYNYYNNNNRGYYGNYYSNYGKK